MQDYSTNPSNAVSRRQFLKSSSLLAASAAAVASFPSVLSAQNNQQINAVIIGLDTEREIEAQVAFLDAELTKAERDHVRWTFVFFHRPIYSSGSHGGSAEEQKAWAPVLVKHKVTAVFCGHDHLYEHSLADGVNYFTSGGGGAPLYAVGQKPNPYHVKGVSTYHFIQVLVRPTNVEIRVVRPNGVLIDRVVVK